MGSTTTVNANDRKSRGMSPRACVFAFTLRKRALGVAREALDARTRRARTSRETRSSALERAFSSASPHATTNGESVGGEYDESADALERRTRARASMFATTRAEAETSARAWARASATRPSASRAFANAHFTKAFVPFWVFDITCEVSYAATVDVDGALVRSGKAAEVRRFDWASSATQVCASFATRRDYVDALRPGANVDFESSATAWEVVRGQTSSRDAKVGAFTMKRSMALALAAVKIRDDVRAEAKREMMRKHKGATAVRDVVIDFATIKRKVCAVYHPVWLVDFAYGAVVDADTNKIIQQPRQAVICGVTGMVISDDLVSETKARAFAFGAVSLPAIIAALAWPEHALAMLGQGAIAAVVAAAGAGVLARQYPQKIHDKMDVERVNEEERAFNLAMRSQGNSDWMDESVQRRRDDAEWRRWMDTDKMRWDPIRRSEWAHNILETHVFRFRERQELRHEMNERAQRAEEAERRAAEKERKWGSDWQRDAGPKQSSGRHPGYSRDVHGFYKTLRLEDKLGFATEEEIKAAFRVVAHETHPDKVTGDAAAKRRAAERFQLAQMAYKTLANKDDRAVYDRK